MRIVRQQAINLAVLLREMGKIVFQFRLNQYFSPVKKSSGTSFCLLGTG